MAAGPGRQPGQHLRQIGNGAKRPNVYLPVGLGPALIGELFIETVWGFFFFFGAVILVLGAIPDSNPRF